MKTTMMRTVGSVSLLVLITVIPALAQESLPAPWKHQNIGDVKMPGTAKFINGVFTLQGTLDIWNAADGCQIAWQPVHGDFELIACVTSMDNPGQVGHAKAGLCVRESLDADSRSVTMCVTAVDGTQFLYRKKTGDPTVRINLKAEDKEKAIPKGQFPCWLKLVRQGKEIRGYESVDGKRWLLSASFPLDLPKDAVLGLTASSHKPDVLTTVTFDHVKLTLQSDRKHGQNKQDHNTTTGQLVTMAIDGTDKHIICQLKNGEAPNWSPDGKWLVFNARGSLWKIPADGSAPPEQIPTGDVKSINNDHVLSPDGQTIYFSAHGHLYAVPFEGGQPRRVSNDQSPERKFQYFLHGVSPDNKTLAYVGAEKVGDDPMGKLNIYTIPTAGGPDTQITSHPQVDDGPEYSADGKWIYFNSELNADVPGHSQCYRMKPDGSGIEQLTHDERVNWFPHISPDGQWVVYLSFPPGTMKHPANKAVILRRMRPDGSEQADIITLNGGQGTINVNSWAPDSRRFAFVMYEPAK